MDINRNNYEHFFLDSIEGKLSSSEEEKLRHFLVLNPDLAIEKSDYELIDFPDNKIVFPAKENLKKVIPQENDLLNDQNFEMFALAYLENDLTVEQGASFTDYIKKNQHRSKEYKVLKATVLKPETIVYDRKDALKKRNPLVFRLTGVATMAAAAAIALLLILGPGEEDAPIQMSETIEMPEVKVAADKEIDSETTKETPKKKSSQATIRVIRNSKNPVPISIPNEGSADPKDTSGNNQGTSSSQRRLASIPLKRAVISEINAQYDQLVPLAVVSPTISRSSLSLTEQARFEYLRAAKIAEDDDVLIWSIASNGIKELNRLTGTDMKLLASKDQDGDISGIQFRSRYLQLTTPIVKEEE